MVLSENLRTGAATVTEKLMRVPVIAVVVGIAADTSPQLARAIDDLSHSSDPTERDAISRIAYHLETPPGGISPIVAPEGIIFAR